VPQIDRTTLFGIAGVVAFALVYGGIASYISAYYEASSPSPSVYSKSGRGLSVWYGYLDRLGLDPGVLTDFDTLPSGATLIIAGPLDASPGPGDAARLERWVRGGGRVVLVGTELFGLVEELGPVPEPADAPASIHLAPSLPGVYASGVGTIEPGEGRFRRGEPAWVAHYDDAYGSALISRRLGSGEVAWLADATSVSNDGIGNADDATLAVLLASVPGRTIHFDEFHHGFVDEATPWDRLAVGGRASFVLLILGAAVLVVGYGRRIGPPIPTPEELPARGGAYISQLAALYRKAGARAEALESLEDGLARALARRYGTRAGGVARHITARDALDASGALRARGAIGTDEFLAVARRLRQARNEVEGT
jgi:hypothetical protein